MTRKVGLSVFSRSDKTKTRFNGAPLEYETGDFFLIIIKSNLTQPNLIDALDLPNLIKPNLK